MSRNWGLPARDAQRAILDAKTVKPVLTLFASAAFGIIAAAIAVLSFAEARSVIADLFHGVSLGAAIVAAGFGCWSYVWLARPRFAAQLSAGGDVFSTLVRFYAIAMVALGILLGAGIAAVSVAPAMLATLILCATGGAAAAAAFQTVLAFVPFYE